MGPNSHQPDSGRRIARKERGHPKPKRTKRRKQPRWFRRTELKVSALDIAKSSDAPRIGSLQHRKGKWDRKEARKKAAY